MKFSEITATIQGLLKHKNRVIVGIAGPPASGKTTLASELDEYFEDALLVQMDGYHLDNEELDRIGLRHRKGAPETFDVRGFLALLKDIHDGDLPKQVPEFDRLKDKVVFSGKSVDSSHNLIIVEGNYLLLKDPLWEELKPIFDFTIFLSPGADTIRERIMLRWQNLDYSADEARSKLDLNDMPNAERVIGGSAKADLQLDLVEY